MRQALSNFPLGCWMPELLPQGSSGCQTLLLLVNAWMAKQTNKQEAREDGREGGGQLCACFGWWEMYGLGIRGRGRQGCLGAPSCPGLRHHVELLASLKYKNLHERTWEKPPCAHAAGPGLEAYSFTVAVLQMGLVRSQRCLQLREKEPKLSRCERRRGHWWLLSWAVPWASRCRGSLHLKDRETEALGSDMCCPYSQTKAGNSFLKWWLMDSVARKASSM